MNNQTNIKLTKEHPILNNIFLFMLLTFIVSPIILMVVTKGVEIKNQDSKAKTENTVGEIMEYTIVTDSKGNALNYNTKIQYDIGNKQYIKLFQTNFFIAEPGQLIVMYYEKGNPYSADVIKSNTKFNLKSKVSLYAALCVVSALLCIFKCYNDVLKARQRKRDILNQQMLFNSINGIQNKG